MLYQNARHRNREEGISDVRLDNSLHFRVGLRSKVADDWTVGIEKMVLPL